ncbi:MAG: diacylglycerol kinase family protein [Polyangiales bacterium]
MTPDAQPTAAPTHAPFFVVYNPSSGSGDDVTEALQRMLGGRHELIAIRQGQVDAAAKDAVQRAKRAGGTVVAAGGDGTIRCVAKHALKEGVKVGILPRGTFNITGRTWGIPLELEASIQNLLDARVRRVQVGTVNDHVFLVNASLGLYPELLEEREQYKRQFGRKRTVALLAGLVTILRHHKHLVLQSEHELGSELVQATTLFVGNNPMQLEDVGLPESEDVKHGQLAAVFVKPVGRLARLGLFVRGLAGKLGGAPELKDFSFEHLTVRPRRTNKKTLKVALDGEIMRLAPPLEFKLTPEPLQLLVPR